ncbi:GntR family transcriptional regulator [Ruegeria sp. HKCCA6707]|uniref:GntR family transcriptional regulator n=1 Tax=Ruegeria sp. HKCCA6707 TaxID=2682996 RepID=UPI00148782AA|nr:GntR family transcriptional regulator [Ruegeria sp. HKCCA6707]
MTTPLYQSVYNEIIARVADGRYPPGTMLPSEFDIAAELGVSQGTARKALSELEAKGIVKRRQGRGTFVALRTPENSLFHFFRMRDAAGNQVAPTLGSETVSRRAATPAERYSLFGAPQEVFQIDRVRNFNDKPLCLETCVVSTDLFPGLLERAPLPNTLYVLFQQAYSCIVISAKDDLSAGLADKATAKALGLRTGTPVLIGKREGKDLLGRVVELRTSRFVTDDVTYSVSLDSL